MIVQKRLFFLFFIFVDKSYGEKPFLSADDNNNTTTFPSYLLNPRFKKEVDLQVFSEKEETEDTSSNNEDKIVYVCGSEINDEIDCSCECDELICVYGLETANVKPLKEKFAFKKAHFANVNIEVLQKGKICPDNEQNIEKITLHHTKTTHIEDYCFDDFDNLKELDFVGLPLSSVNENIFTEKLGTSLTTLRLVSNGLTGFDPNVLKYLFNLQILILSENQQQNGKFSKFPESLKGLKHLYINNCGLSHLDEDTFVNLVQLKDLLLYSNAFVNIPTALNVLLNLETLDFGANHLEVIPQNSFKNNLKLENLYLGGSRNLRVIEDCAFCSLQNLKTTRLYDCPKLSYIHPNAYGAISNGYVPEMSDEFSIEGGNITVLPENLLDWKKISMLMLNGNPFSCNCSMAWLFKDLLSKDSVYEKKLHGFGETEHHHKYYLGCLGPPPTTPNHTHLFTMFEIFNSCKAPTSFNYFWFLIRFVILFFAGVGIYYGVNSRTRIVTIYSRFF